MQMMEEKEMLAEILPEPYNNDNESDEYIPEHDEYEMEEHKKGDLMSASSLLDIYEDSVEKLDELHLMIKTLDISIDYVFIKNAENISITFNTLYMNQTMLDKNGFNSDVSANFKSQLKWLLNYLINRSTIFSLRDHKRSHTVAIARLNHVITELYGLIHEKSEVVVLNDNELDISSAMRSNKHQMEEYLIRKQTLCCGCRVSRSTKKVASYASCVLISVLVLLVVFFMMGKV